MIALTAAQEKTKMYRDDEVTQAFSEINLHHAKLQRTDASLELRKHEPNVHIQSEVNIYMYVIKYCK